MVFEMAIIIEVVKGFFLKAASAVVAFFKDPKTHISNFIEAVKSFFLKAVNAVVAFFKDPKAQIINFIANVKAYFSSLTQYELYAWAGEGVGFVLMIISIVIW
ncbi:MAG: hypothetical protein V1866_06790 [archaeon]